MSVDLKLNFLFWLQGFVCLWCFQSSVEILKLKVVGYSLSLLFFFLVDSNSCIEVYAILPLLYSRSHFALYIITTSLTILTLSIFLFTLWFSTLSIFLFNQHKREDFLLNAKKIKTWKNWQMDDKANKKGPLKRMVWLASKKGYIHGSTTVWWEREKCKGVIKINYKNDIKRFIHIAIQICLTWMQGCSAPRQALRSKLNWV